MDELIPIVSFDDQQQAGTSMDFSGLFGSMFGQSGYNSESMNDLMSQYMRFIRENTDYNNAWSAQQAERQMDFQAQSQQIAQQFNAEEAARNRNWQQYMSSTAHQREIADLKAAGLNPILSATGGNGAAVTSGATASSQAMSGAKGDGDQSANAAIVNILGTAFSAMTALASKNIEAQTSMAVATKYTEMERIIEDMREDYSTFEHTHFPDTKWEVISSIISQFVHEFNSGSSGSSGKSIGEIYNEGDETLPAGLFSSLGTLLERGAANIEKSRGSTDVSLSELWQNDDIAGVFGRIASILGKGVSGISVLRGFLFNPEYRERVVSRLSSVFKKTNTEVRDMLFPVLGKYFRGEFHSGHHTDSSGRGGKF